MAEAAKADILVTYGGQMIPQRAVKSLLCALLFLCACTKKQAAVAPPVDAGPEQAVRQFVEMSAGVKSVEDRQKLAALCQGRMKRAFDGLSEDAFMITYVNQPMKIKAIHILSSQVDGNLGRIHYKVEVDNPGGQDATLEVSEREVEMLKVDGQWYLEAIRPKGSDQVAFTRGMFF